LLEVLKNPDTFHLGYRAAFAYPIAERLAVVSHKTLLMAQQGDPLLANTEQAAALLPHAAFAAPSRADAAAVVASFLVS